MTYGSLFSGLGGIDLAFDRRGMECRWQVECDADALRVLEHHWPNVKRGNDVRTWALTEKVDIIVGGFPCQDLSLAGDRGGLSGERSGLFYEIVRIVSDIQPRLVVWENVPGLLSSDEGRDMLRVLRAFADIGYFGGWQVLDARFFGVPQRRRRVFGVFAYGHLGAERASQILAFKESSSRHSPPSRQEQQEIASTLRGRSSRPSVNPPGRGGECDQNLVVGTLTAHSKRHGHNMKSGQAASQNQFVVFGNNRSEEQDLGGITVKNRCDFSTQTFVAGKTFVRIFTPTECLRLQGLPDDWLDLDPTLSDSAKYRLIGNSVAVPVLEWIGRRIMDSRPAS